jgi:hypothetical protein
MNPVAVCILVFNRADHFRADICTGIPKKKIDVFHNSICGQVPRAQIVVK